MTWRQEWEERMRKKALVRRMDEAVWDHWRGYKEYALLQLYFLYDELYPEDLDGQEPLSSNTAKTAEKNYPFNAKAASAAPAIP